MSIEGDWFDATLDQNDKSDNFGVFLFPTGTNRLYDFTEAMYISSNSQYKDQAAAFLDYVTQADVQTTNLGVFGATSVTLNVASSKASALDQAWPPILASTKGIFANADQAFSTDITTEYWRIQNLVVTDKLDPAQAGPQFQTFLDAHKPS